MNSFYLLITFPILIPKQMIGLGRQFLPWDQPSNLASFLLGSELEEGVVPRRELSLAAN